MSDTIVTTAPAQGAPTVTPAQEATTPPVGWASVPVTPEPIAEHAQGAPAFDAAYVKSLRAEAAASRVKLREFEAAEITRAAAAETARLADLSAVDRLTAQLATAEAKAKGLEIHAARSKAAAAHALSDDLLEFITAEDEAGALAQAAKLAARLNPTALPTAGGRNPANGGTGAQAQSDTEAFDIMRQRIPSLNSRVLRTN